MPKTHQSIFLGWGGGECVTGFPSTPGVQYLPTSTLLMGQLFGISGYIRVLCISLHLLGSGYVRLLEVGWCHSTPAHLNFGHFVLIERGHFVNCHQTQKDAPCVALFRWKI